MIKEVLIGAEAKTELKNGINTLADIVEVTLGPQGQYVILDKNYIIPHATKDGVSVAREVSLNDRVQNIGCTMLKTVAQKTADEAGDGTTTSIVIGRSMFTEGLKEIQENGTNPIEVQRGMQKAARDIIEQIRHAAVPISSEQDLKYVATVSANGDTETGSMIGELVYNIGAKGNIIIKDSDTYNTYVEKVDGIKFDSGYISYYFCNDLENQKCNLNNPLVLVSLEKIVNWRVLEPFIKYSNMVKRPLLVVCDEMVGEALALLTANVANKNASACAIKAPGYANNRRELLEDICHVTGAKLIGNDTGFPFNEALKKAHVNLNSVGDYLGSCESVIVDRNGTTFFINDSVKEKIDERIKQIEGHRDLNEGKLIKAK
jgi:chaperonin GroEL